MKTAPAPAAPKAPATPAPAPPARELSLQILVLDDEPTITEMVSEMLSLLGQGRNMQDTLSSILRVSDWEFERGWRDYLKERYGRS